MRLQEVIRNVTGKPHDKEILHLLRDFREKFSSETAVRETAYLKGFAELKTINGPNPKYIIRDTLIIYLRSVCDIYKQPNLLQLFTFTYHDHDHVNLFKYSNYLMFSDDIVIICFLYCVSKSLYKECETFQTLKSLMTNKYGIDIEQKVDDTESSKNKLTLRDIAFSYPSILSEIFIKMNSKMNSKISYLRANFYLPDAMFLPTIIYLLPTLDEAPPFAILLLLKLDKVIGKRLDNTTIQFNLLLNSIYERFKYEIFPEGLQLELCKKWQIVEKKNNTYKYNPCFEKYRQKVKDIIAKMQPNDPDLESVLSRL